MIRLIAEFLRRIIRRWGVLVTSGAIIGVISLWPSTGHNVARPVYWAVAGCGLVVAAFRTWFDEHNAVEALRTELAAWKRSAFAGEFLRASGNVTVFSNGTSPHVRLFVWALVHNRNPEPTTVYVHRGAVRLRDGSDELSQIFTIVPGGHFDFESPEEYQRYSVAGSSSIELLLFGTRYNPPQVEKYLEQPLLEITLELHETFGNVLTLTGPLAMEVVERH